MKSKFLNISLIFSLLLSSLYFSVPQKALAADSWSTGAAGGTARFRHQSILYNGKIYSWGGQNGATKYNTMDIYDIATNTWSTGTTGGTARFGPTVVLSSDKIYF